MNPQIRWNLEKKVRYLRIFFTLLFIFYGLYYGYVQIIQHGYFSKTATGQAIRSQRIHATRGLIYDREGRLLVLNSFIYDAVIYREDLPQGSDQTPLIEVGKTLDWNPDQLINSLESYRQNKKGLEPFVFRSFLTQQELAMLEQFRSRFPYLSIEQAPRRNYPHSETLGHVMGYIGEVDQRLLKKNPAMYELGQWVGREGIELSADDYLRGIDGAKRVLVNNLGQEIEELTEESQRTGRSVMLTIDLGLQQQMQEAFKGKKGAGIILNPQTGEILALYSAPSINPNVFTGRMTQAVVDLTFNNSDKPMMNRVTQGIYPPGSTFKVLTAIAGLQKKVIAPATVIYCAGKKNYYGRDFRCDKLTGHGPIALVEAIEKSCDIYFYEVASRLDVDDLFHVAQEWGLTQETGVELRNEKKSRVPSRAWKAQTSPLSPKWYGGETISVGIGQGQVGLTPIALAQFYATLATKGLMMKPHLIRGTKDETTGAVDLIPLVQGAKINLDSTWWPLIEQGLLNAVRSGTAASSRLQDIDMLGKTGTAQVAKFVDRAHYLRQAKNLRDHGWFAGYAPQENPQMAFVILVENGGFGADSAAPIASRLVKYWMKDRFNQSTTGIAALPPP